VENVDGVIYLIEKEGVNVERNTNFNKNYSNFATRDKGTAESEKFLAEYYTEKKEWR
jgi:hypothetical protein